MAHARHRHCERSEAIHLVEQKLDCFVASRPCTSASRLCKAMTDDCVIDLFPKEETT